MASPELRGDTFQVDPAVEIICRNWRCSTPTTPDSPLSSALEARNKRIKKVKVDTFSQITIHIYVHIKYKREREHQSLFIF